MYFPPIAPITTSYVCHTRTTITHACRLGAHKRILQHKSFLAAADGAQEEQAAREAGAEPRVLQCARAHQSLLASAGSGAAPPAFIGFASFAQPAPNAIQATPKVGSFYAKPVVQSIYDGSDHEIALALKMLAKKGAVTKIKALQTFLQDVLPPRAPAELRPMLGHFTQLYTFEMRDQNDRKVRQLLNEVLAALCDKMRPRAFVPHLQRLLPYWYLAMHDVNADVAVLAKKAFTTLFPETEMQKTVLEEHAPAMMEEFQSFFTKTPDSFEAFPCSQMRRRRGTRGASLLRC